MKLIKEPNIICYNYLKFQTTFVEKVTVSKSVKHDTQINKHRNVINLQTNKNKINFLFVIVDPVLWTPNMFHWISCFSGS
jgi:hypothetical protein